MKRIVMIIAMIAALPAALIGQQQTFPSSVTVTGKAEREVTPNEIHMKITIDESSTKGRVTVAEQEKKMIAALRALGIDVEKDLQIGNIAGDLQTYVFRKDRVLTTKSYELKVTDAPTLTNVFKVLADLGVSKAAITRATRSDVNSIRMELRTEAMRDAQSNARTLAEAVGQRIGKAFQINEYGYSDAMYKYDASDRGMAMTRAEADQGSEASSLEFKTLKITHSVNVQFVLE